jgi:hypothetical protein
MGRGFRNTTRSEVQVPKEFEYTAPIQDFFEFFGILGVEEIRSLYWDSNGMITLRTREIVK